MENPDVDVFEVRDIGKTSVLSVLKGDHHSGYPMKYHISVETSSAMSVMENTEKTS